MLIGAHIMIQSTNDAADKAFFKEVLKLPFVDAGGDFLLFAVPPSEIAIHAGPTNGAHQLYLMCKDVKGFAAEMGKRGIATGAINDQGWGVLTEITLPGGGKLAVYEPRHARPAASAKVAAKKGRAKKAKKAAKKKPAKAKKKKAVKRRK